MGDKEKLNPSIVINIGSFPYICLKNEFEYLTYSYQLLGLPIKKACGWLGGRDTTRLKPC